MSKAFSCDDNVSLTITDSFKFTTSSAVDLSVTAAVVFNSKSIDLKAKKIAKRVLLVFF